MPSRHYHLGMEKDKYPSEEADRFMVRMPDGMRARLAEEARKNGRSMNAEVVGRLQASFEQVRAPVTEMEVAAYKSHALALSTQAMAMQHQLVDMMAKLPGLASSNPSAAKATREQIAAVNAKIREIDQMTNELSAKAAQVSGGKAGAPAVAGRRTSKVAK